MPTDRSPDAAAEFYERTRMSLEEWGDPDQLPPAIEAGTAGPSLALPHVAPSSWPSLEQSIVWRRTSRSFDPRGALHIDTLARLLAFSCGLTAAMDLSGGLPTEFHRAAPSAGARFPLDTFLVASRVSDLPPGAYAYDLHKHELATVRLGLFADQVAQWALYQPWMANASVVFALVGTPARTTERYASRGYRYILLEAGHIAQNLYLLGSAYNLCVQATGGFFEDAFCKLFGLDGTDRQVLYLVAMGPPSPDRGLAPW